MSEELITTRTYSLDECKGNAFWLEGNDSFYPIGGLATSAMVGFICKMLKIKMLITVFLVPLPAIIAFVWLLLFVYKKPRGYQVDLFEMYLGGDVGEPDKKQPVDRFEHLKECIKYENA